MRSRLLLFLGLFALTAIVYMPVSRFGFVEFDDPYYVYENPHLSAGLSAENLKFACTSFIGANWNPLVWISFETDQVLWHLDPRTMHLENVLLHAMAAAILFLLLADATGSPWRSAMVAALFSCHPLHVESVAWISERKDVLSTPLLFAAIAMYVRYARAMTARSRASYYLAVLIAYALSLSAKSMGVTLPGILLLLDIWPLRRSTIKEGTWHWKWLDKIPIACLALAVSVVTMLAQKSLGAVNPIPLPQRISNALVCFVIYIGKLFVPTNLAVYYPLPATRPFEAVLTAGVMILILTAIAWRLRNNCPYLLIGWLWFVGTLIPVIGLVQVGGQAMADRYSYLPSVGLCIAAVWGAADSIRRVIRNTTAQWIVCGSLATIVITVLAIVARQQVSYWHDNQTLFTHAMEVTDNNGLAAVMLGRDARLRGDLPVAFGFISQAIRFNNADADAHDELGLCLTDRAPLHAIPEFVAAVKFDPRSIMYRLHLIDALERTGQIESAIQQCRNALAIDPQSAAAQKELALLFASVHTQSSSHHGSGLP